MKYLPQLKAQRKTTRTMIKYERSVSSLSAMHFVYHSYITKSKMIQEQDPGKTICTYNGGDAHDGWECCMLQNQSPPGFS